MYNVAIIGAGQLGSRHLQGLKNASLPLSITVVDSSETSLAMARARYDVVPCIGEKSVRFVSRIELLPSELDLVIVATGSIPRAGIIKTLLDICSVRYLILEKVLFPMLAQYDEVEVLLKEKDVKCWVNCPRRMFGFYRELKTLLDPSAPVEMTMGNKDWSLCCNGIHFIDLFMFLTGAEQYSTRCDGLDRVIHQSKRSGYVEMTGTLEVETPDGGQLTLVSKSDFSGVPGIIIKNGRKQFHIDEQSGIWSEDGQEKTIKIPYQSQLTGVLSDLLLLTGSCLLTPYKISAAYHKAFLTALLPFYNEINGEESELLPIT